MTDNELIMNFTNKQSKKPSGSLWLYPLYCGAISCAKSSDAPPTI